MPAEKLFFDTIKEHRGDYFVEYSPPSGDFDFATLGLTFLKAADLKQVALTMQSELRKWLTRYPVPLMVSAFDETGSILRMGSDRVSAHLVGWVSNESREIVDSWNLADLTEHLKTVTAAQDWRSVYSDVPFKTKSEVAAAASKTIEARRRQVLLLKIVFVSWLAVIPAVWAVIEFFSPVWLAAALLGLALWEAFRTARKIWISDKGAPESAEAAKRRKMEHYYYHCERNPEGFARLMAQNLENDLREKVLKDAARIGRPSNERGDPVK